jgi:hypothetical protein
MSIRVQKVVSILALALKRKTANGNSKSKQ